MKDVFSNLYNNIINKDCCFIQLEFGSGLRIGIGEKIYYKNPKLKGMYHGEWDLYSRTFAWRIFKDNRFLCGSDDEPEFIDSVLINLKESIIISNIESKNISDISIYLSNGMNIDFFCCCTDDNQMLIMNKDTTIYEFTIEGIHELSTNKDFDKLTEIESILENLSEKCNKRWENKVPKDNSFENCDDCFYFRGISGRFYFWDFGICSNAESPHDGKLVGSQSGCKYHSHLKDIISTK